MEQLTFKLEVFEGPLDLMLHLISKHKLDIEDIEIACLLEQFLDYIEQMKEADLEVTSEFLTMAARLVYIKTVSLLPVHDESDELKKELTGQLLEYRICKEIAEKLRKQSMEGSIFIRTAMSVTVDKTYCLKHSSHVLMEAYLLAIGKAKRKLPPPRTAFTSIVSRRIVSVESRIVYVLKKLYNDEKVAYNDFFRADDRSEQVATFLAMLELIKSKRIRVSDDNSYVYFSKSDKTFCKM